ncbi:hypothetical protein PTSG_00645 [Salpingoeca rosetta]|uniref:Uncharacterized protein n=1 Tax=Salpingoeca rosetta (strain ATCC 50818 / BSB-021) TaxID=946362 RepID=F2TX29_SALR5|nr:uncharacterized protein PTSG_00645 [Salpingoeca rosetta]EGD75938.1 hypothetical protein PTSG_00645 [Salpingoeca rosetta]|eukprot:XP_004998114.1 hypothetical protein PTSG_00645 [Salpingoeca rosetta]
MELTGDIAQKNPFAAQNRREKLERLQRQRAEEERRKREAEEQEWLQKQEQKELARLKKEAELAEARAQKLAVFERQRLEEERRKEEEARRAEDRRRQEEQRRKQREEEERQRRLYEERLRQQREEEEAERKRQEKLAKQQQFESQLKAQMQQAEQQAERTAAMMRQAVEIERMAREAVQLKLITENEAQRHKAAAVSRDDARVHSSHATLVALIQGYKQQQLEEQQREEARRRQQQAEERERQQREAERMKRADASAHSPKSPSLQRKQEAAPVVSGLNNDVSLREIPDALLDEERCMSAALSLEKHLCNVLVAGQDAFVEYLEEFGSELHMDKLLPALAQTIAKYPCHVPALTNLGLLAFGGHSKTYKRIRELNCLPDSSKEWLGWLLACRIYLEYSTWWQTCYLAGKLTPWTSNVEKLVSSFPDKFEEEDKQISKFAEAKLHDLLSSMGLVGTELSAEEVAKHQSTIVAKLPLMIKFFQVNKGKVSSFKQEFEKQLGAIAAHKSATADSEDVVQQMLAAKQKAQQLHDEIEKRKTEKKEVEESIKELQVKIEQVRAPVGERSERAAALKQEEKEQEKEVSKAKKALGDAKAELVALADDE